jgi:hypothetical protein
VERQAERIGAVHGEPHGRVTLPLDTWGQPNAGQEPKLPTKDMKFAELPLAMTPEQFAFWVKGIAAVTASTTAPGILEAILGAARRLK